MLVRKIQLAKGGYSVSMPINLVRELGWQDKQKVTVKRQSGTLVIKDWKG